MKSLVAINLFVVELLLQMPLPKIFKSKSVEEESSSGSDVKELSLTIALTDAGLYSYAAIISAALSQLFQDECHK